MAPYLYRCNKSHRFATNHVNSFQLQQEGGKPEFEVIVTTHEPLLRKICRLYARTADDRQDLFQEIVIQLWRSYPGYKGTAKLSTWLYRVALNTAITGMRQKNKRLPTDGDTDALEHLKEDEYDSTRDEQLQQLYTAIAKLDEVSRAIVMLYMDDKGYDEMEDIMGIAQATLRVRMSRIKDRLRELTKN